MYKPTEISSVAQGRQGVVELGLSLFEQEGAPNLGDGDRDQDIEHHRGQERVPGHHNG